ncbi:MAG: RNA polymerase-binding protein DksA [Thermodesulfobacteriota bacterium]
MNASELQTYKEILIRKLAELLGVAEDTLTQLSSSNILFPDPLDRALSESNRSIELKKRDRERKLIQKIQKALNKIEDGSYGICENCGEYITEQRLKVRPEATMCISCKEEEEENEKKFGS